MGRLPPECELTTALGITRNTLRKALDALEREGTIWRHVGKGTFVAARADGLEERAKLHTELGRQLTPFKMMRARLAIEPAKIWDVDFWQPTVMKFENHHSYCFSSDLFWFSPRHFCRIYRRHFV